MKYLIVVGVVALCAVSGLLGLTAGINLNPDSIVKFVPNWGSLGDWVSGVGALLAVITSLALVRRSEASQAERERERFVVDQFVQHRRFSIRVVSMSSVPSVVRSILLEAPSGVASNLMRYLPEPLKVRLPKRLETRSEIHLAWLDERLPDFLREIQMLQISSLDEVSISVRSSLAVYRFPLSGELTNLLLMASAELGIPLLLPEHIREDDLTGDFDDQ